MRILFITPYPVEGASSRFRVWQYVPRLRDLGHQVEVAPFFSPSGYRGFYRPGAWLWKLGVLAAGFYRRLLLLPAVRRADVVVIHRAAAPIGPPWLERLYRRMNSRLVYDFDDALFIRHTSAVHQRLAFLKPADKTATLIKLSRRALAGNEFLAHYARGVHADVHVLPTVVEIPQHLDRHGSGSPVVIGWIGSPTTAPFLDEIADALRQVKARYGPRVEIRLIGAGTYRLPQLEATYRSWALERETKELGELDIGLMPLPDTLWARGKCGLKALQYMSARVPVVCSPVGVNPGIVIDGESGFLPARPSEWVGALSRLIEDGALRRRMGEKGRQRVEADFSVERWAARLAQLLTEVAGDPTRRQSEPSGTKVLRVLTRMNIGGPAIHAVLLTVGLNSGRFRSVLAAGRVSPEEGEMSDFALEHGVQPVWIPELGRPVRIVQDFRAFRRLCRLIRCERPDVLHTHMAKAGTLARLAGWLAGVPVRVHTYHGHVFEGYFGGIQSRLAIIVERILARLSTALVAVSPSVRNDLVDRFHIAAEERIHVVRLGFDLDRFLQARRDSAVLRQRLGVGGRVPLVGVVGRMVPVKNHALFLQAARKIHDRRPDVHFALIGGGELEADLRELTERLGLVSVTHFVGWQRAMERVYPDLDVLVLTSKNEGSPVVLIEAMASGVPVVATRVGGVVDLIDSGHNGILIEPEDAGALADAVLALLADPQRARKMVAAGREFVRGRFDVQRLLRDIEALYDRLLTTSASSEAVSYRRGSEQESLP